MATSYKGLTVKFGADTQALSTALRKINTEAKKTTSDLKEIDKALKIDPKNTELLTQKQHALQRALGETADKTKVYRSALEDLARKEQVQGQLTQEQQRQYESIQRNIITAKAAHDDYQRELRETEDALRGVTTATGDASQATGRSADDVADSASRLSTAGAKLRDVGGKLTRAGGIMTATVSLPLIAAGKAAVDAASDTEESLNKVNVAFGDSASNIEQWSHTTLDSYGIARGTALDMAALFGDMATGMGFSQQRAAEMSQSLVGLAGDVASFKNLDLDQAQNTLKGIFTGETESLKNIGVVMTQDILKAFAESRGVVYDELDQVGLVELRYAYVTQALSNAQGDFSETSDGYANSARVLQESLQELAAAFGEELLPVITPLVKELTGLIREFGKLDDGTKQAIIRAGLLAVAAGPVLSAIGGITSGIGGIMQIGGMVQGAGGIAGLLGAAEGASGLAGIAGIAGTALPVALGIAGVAAVGLGVTWLATTEEGQAAWQGFCDFVTSVWDSVCKGVQDAMQGLADFFSGIWQGIQDAWAWLGDQITGNTHVSNVSPLNGGTIPGLASGALVTGPTLALIGEGRGAEYVEPRSSIVQDMAQALRIAGRGQQGGLVINVAVQGEGKSARTLGEDIARSAASMLRQMGR